MILRLTLKVILPVVLAVLAAHLADTLLPQFRQFDMFSLITGATFVAMLNFVFGN